MQGYRDIEHKTLQGPALFFVGFGQTFQLLLQTKLRLGFPLGSGVVQGCCNRIRVLLKVEHYTVQGCCNRIGVVLEVGPAPTGSGSILQQREIQESETGLVGRSLQ